MKEYTHYWHAQDLHNMELLHARYITHRFDRHVHENYAIGVIEHGTEAFFYRGVKDNTAPAGSIVIVNPNEIHTGYAVTASGWRYRMFYPGVTFMRSVAYELTGQQWDTPYFPDPIVIDPALRLKMLALHRQLEASVDRLALGSMARGVFGALLLRYATNRATAQRTGTERAVVRRARAYLDEHLAANISLDVLAAHVGMSPYHLLRVFQKETGITPHAYRTAQRISRAKVLLTAGVPIAEVALKTGFSDQSHLTNRFKGIVGVPPGAYVGN